MGLRFPLLSACSLLTLLSFAIYLFFRLIYIARYALSSLNVSSGGKKVEIFRKYVGYLHFMLLHQARVFIYKFVLERLAYVSCINFIELFVCRLFCVLYDIVWFCSGKALCSRLKGRSSSSDCSFGSMLCDVVRFFLNC